MIGIKCLYEKAFNLTRYLYQIWQRCNIRRNCLDWIAIAHSCQCFVFVKGIILNNFLLFYYKTKLYKAFDNYSFISSLFLDILDRSITSWRHKGIKRWKFLFLWCDVSQPWKCHSEITGFPLFGGAIDIFSNFNHDLYSSNELASAILKQLYKKYRKSNL